MTSVLAFARDVGGAARLPPKTGSGSDRRETGRLKFGASRPPAPRAPAERSPAEPLLPRRWMRRRPRAATIATGDSIAARPTPPPRPPGEAQTRTAPVTGGVGGAGAHRPSPSRPAPLCSSLPPAGAASPRRRPPSGGRSRSRHGPDTPPPGRELPGGCCRSAGPRCRPGEAPAPLPPSHLIYLLFTTPSPGRCLSRGRF